MPAPVSDFMYCPRCRAQMKKSAAAWVQSHLRATGTPFIGLGRASTTTCPACGAALDVETMLAGGYDRRIETADERAARRRVTLVVLGFVALGVAAHFVAGTGFWGSVGLAVAALVAGALAVGLVRAGMAGPRPRVCRLCGTPNTTRRCTHCGGKV